MRWSKPRAGDGGRKTELYCNVYRFLKLASAIYIRHIIEAVILNLVHLNDEYSIIVDALVRTSINMDKYRYHL